ncbi:MAG: thiamine pyrophosphate-binding protein [Alphaproteobacteria bacterium]|nr:thiamine pyrophosphate-binding protein [Alphaproteobacteria bacterium]
MMKRDEALALLARHVTDEAVVATYQAAFDWMRLAPRDLNYVSIGAMGIASSHALGLALGRPDRRVVVLDGDGSLLMNLGSLATIAGAAPRNLAHLVCVNGCYEANGSHPLPARDALDFAAIARGAGIRDAGTIATLAEFEHEIPAILRGDGPVFRALLVEPGAPSTQDYAFIHGAETRRRFKAAWSALP